MEIKSVDLTISAVRCSQYPESGFPEFLLVGRSNVGKSSFINTVINRKNYARTSSDPGKTQTINFYNVNNQFFIVDAPGYGYAKVSKKQKKKFGLMMERYLTSRDNLKHVFMLIDLRHKPTGDDVLMYKFLKHHNLPVTIVATKADKVGSTNHAKQRQIIIDELNLVVDDELLLFSNLTKLGRKEVLDKIERTIIAEN